jgi:hypothetical protein
VLLRLVFDTHQRGGKARDLELLRDHQRDRLAAEANLVVIQRTERRAGRGDLVVVCLVGRGKLGPVRMREHGDHALDRHGILEIEALDAPLGDGG